MQTEKIYIRKVVTTIVLINVTVGETWLKRRRKCNGKDICTYIQVLAEKPNNIKYKIALKVIEFRTKCINHIVKSPRLKYDNQDENISLLKTRR